MVSTMKHTPGVHSGAAKVQAGVMEMKDAALDRAASMKDAAMDRASALKDAAWERAVAAKDAAVETGSKVAERGVSLFHQYCDDTEAMIKAHPMQSLMIAGGVGFVLGAMLLRRARRRAAEDMTA